MATYSFPHVHNRSATSFSTYAGKVHIDHYIWYQKLMYLLAKAGCEPPCSRRGVPQGPTRVKPDEGALNIHP